MAALQRAKSAGFGANEVLTSTQANTIDTNAAAGVARASTVSGAKAMPLAFAGFYGSSATVYQVLNGQAYMNITTATATSRYVSFDLIGLPKGHELYQTIVRLKAAVGHAGQPAILPHATVYSIGTYGTSSVVGTASWTWTTTAAYEATGGISLSVDTIGHTITSNVYRVQLRGETGANAAGPLYIKSLICAVNVDKASGGTDFTFWK